MWAMVISVSIDLYVKMSYIIAVIKMFTAYGLNTVLVSNRPVSNMMHTRKGKRFYAYNLSISLRAPFIRPTFECLCFLLQRPGS